MSSCAIDIHSGIGNAMHCGPVTHWARQNYDKVYANYVTQGFPRQAFDQVWRVIKSNFDDLYIDSKNLSVDFHIKSPLLPPILGTIPKFGLPEYKQYFVGNGIEVSDELDWRVDYENIDDQVDVLFVPTSKPNWRSKIWKKWPELAELFHSKGHKLGVVGLNKEGGEFFDYVVDYRNKLSLAQIGGLARKAKITICLDGGVGHYLGYLGISNIYFIFAATTEVKNLSPRRKGQYVIRKSLPCAPCQQRPNMPFAKNQGCKPLYCIEDLSAQEVYNFIEQSFKEYSDDGYFDGY